MKLNKQNKPKPIKWQKVKLKKNMQVMKDMRVKFVSAVGVHHLTSFLICLWSFHFSRFYCLTFGKIKKPSAAFKPAKWGLCWFSWMLQAEGG